MINCTDPECKLIKTYDSAERKAIEEQLHAQLADIQTHTKRKNGRRP